MSIVCAGVDLAKNGFAIRGVDDICKAIGVLGVVACAPSVLLACRVQPSAPDQMLTRTWPDSRNAAGTACADLGFDLIRQSMQSSGQAGLARPL